MVNYIVLVVGSNTESSERLFVTKEEAHIYISVILFVGKKKKKKE